MCKYCEFKNVMIDSVNKINHDYIELGELGFVGTGIYMNINSNNLNEYSLLINTEIVTPKDVLLVNNEQKIIIQYCPFCGKKLGA